MLLMQQQEYKNSGNGLPEPNTFIGGVSSTITSASLLASKLSISESDIQNFTIVGNNIACLIDVDYSIEIQGFRAIGLNYYIDKDGYCISLNNQSFDRQDLNIIILPNAGIYGSGNFSVNQGFINHDIISIPKATPIGATASNENNFTRARINTLYTNSVNETNNGGLPDGDITGAESINNVKYSINLTSPNAINNLALDAVYATILKFSFTEPVSTNDIDYYLIFNGINFLGKITYQNPALKGFSSSTNYSELKAISLDEMGNISGFSNSISVTTITTDITDLALENSYGTALKLGWSFVFNSEIDEYEVYLDNVLNKTVTSQEAFITGLSLNTDYDIKVRGKYNNGDYTAYSNILTQTTDVSEDIPYGNIVSYWNFNSNSKDQVGSNNGLDTGISYIASGGIGNVADFTAGNTSTIQVADNDSLSFGNGTSDSPFTISLMVKFNITGASMLINKSNGSFREYDIFYDTGSNQLIWRIYNNGSTSSSIKVSYDWSANGQTTGVWYSIIGTYNGSGLNSGLKLYVDSLIVGSAATTGTYTAMLNSSSPIYIGKFATITAVSLNGYMDEISIFNKELNSSEVSEIYSKQQSGLALTE